MNEIAKDTGGKVFENTNGLAAALKKVTDERRELLHPRLYAGKQELEG